MLSSKKTTNYLFYAYLILLTWGILFKFETQLSYIPFFYGPRILNLIPFSEPLVVNGDIVFAEMGFNLLVFVPFGVCLPLIKQNWSFWKIIGCGFLLSFLYESLQYILTIGMADVTDLIFNTLGVGVGLLVYLLFKKIFKSKTRQWVNTIGLVVIGLSFIALILLFILGI